MDYYFLNDMEQLLKYTEFDKLCTLNVMEKILLAKVISEQSDIHCKEFLVSLLKYFQEKRDSIKKNTTRFNTLFKIALAAKYDQSSINNPLTHSNTNATNTLRFGSSGNNNNNNNNNNTRPWVIIITIHGHGAV
eukprot:528705_1